jgi:hypothetical protein
MFENRLLGRICAPKKEEMKEKWGKFYNEELHSVYSSSDVSGLSNQGGWGDFCI